MPIGAIAGPLIGGGFSLVNALLGRGAQQDANNINWQSLFETRRRNKATEQLATAPRQDAYGNRTTYQPGVGFQTELVPIIKAIMDAQQNEQLHQLREDAPRNRAAAERKDLRSRHGDEAFNEAFNEFRYRPQTTEGSEVDDATRAILGARRKGLDESSALVARQLMRTGGSADLASILKQTNDQYAGSLEDAILKGRALGKQNFQSSQGRDLQNDFSELGFLRGIADDTTTSPVGMPGDEYAAGVNNTQNLGMQQLISAMQNGTASNAAASARVAQGVGNSALDLSGVARSLSGLDFSGPEPEDPNDKLHKQLQNALLAQKLGINIGSLGGYGEEDDPSIPSSNDPWAGLRTPGRGVYFG